MAFEIKEIVDRRLGENYTLHDLYVNQALVKVLRTIGFDKVYKRAEGAYLWDQDGKDYLDFLGGYSSMNLGRNHPAIKKVIRDVLELDLPNMVQMDCSLLSGLLAEALVKHSPPHLNAAFLCNSGTEAVEGAIKFARCATGREKLLYVERAFHGLSTGSLALNGSIMFKDGFGRLLESESVPMEDLAVLEGKLRTREFAAFFIEPIQGKSVQHPKSDDYWLRAQELCHKYGTLLAIDEVQTGLGRTGKWFAFEHWNLEPDIVCIAKSLSGGLVPCGAILTRREIYNKTFSRMDRCVVHSTTFGRNNLAMACGLATLHVMDEEKITENAERMGKRLMDGLLKLKEKHEFISDVRGKGLMIAIEFSEPKSLKLRAAWRLIQVAEKGLFAQMVVIPLLKDHRILTQVASHKSDVIKITPPLIIGEKEIDRFLQAFDEVLQSCYKFPGAMWDMGSNLVKAALSAKRAA
jgi:ornithine--oxo-acid transaminase